MSKHILQFLVLTAIFLAYSFALNLTSIPWERAYIPANFISTLVVLWVALHIFKLSLSEIGIVRTRILNSVILGMLAGILLTFIGFIIIVIPFSDRFPSIADERTATTFSALVVKLLIWIPLGTVILEEVLFRGVLPQILRRHGSSIKTAHVISSIVFGFWHLAPALRSLSPSTDPLHILGIFGVVLLTAVGGLLYAIMREWRKSLFAPMAMHWAVNGSATAALFLYPQWG